MIQSMRLGGGMEIAGQPRMPAPSGSGFGRFRVLAVSGAIAAQLLLGLAWSLASAPASSPDDDYHLASIWCAWGAEETGCEVLSRPVAPQPLGVFVPELSKRVSGCSAFRPNVSARCTDERVDGSAGPVPPRAWPGRADNGDYPPGFYAAQRLLVGESVLGSIFAMRLANYIVCVVLLAAAGMLLTRSQRRWMWLYWTAASVPLGLFLFASTNPSGVATAAVAATFGGQVAALAPGRSIIRGVAAVALVVLGIAVACASRPDALYFCLLAVVAGALITWPRGMRLQRAFAVLTPVAVALTLAGMARNRVVSGAIDAPEGLGADDMHNLVNAPLMYVGEFATTLGWMDTRMPAWVWVGLALCMFALTILGLMGLCWRSIPAVALLAAVGIALPVYLLHQVGSLVGESVQPRYLLPVVFVAAGVLALCGQAAQGRTRARLSSRPVLSVVVLVLTVAHAGALHTTMRRSITGLDVASFDLNGSAEWWWPISLAPMTVWLAGSCAFGVLTFMQLMALLRGRSDGHGLLVPRVAEEVDDDLAGVELVEDRRDP